MQINQCLKIKTQLKPEGSKNKVQGRMENVSQQASQKQE